MSLCQFRLIQSIFRSIEILLNYLRKPLSISIDRNCFEIVFLNFLTSLCLFRSIETVFRSIETRESRFKKFRFDLFKTFQNFFLSLKLGKAPLRFFCRFPPIFLQGFSLPKPVFYFTLPFALLFTFSCINLMIFWVFFELCYIWDF